MKCPKCGNEMEKGKLVMSSAGLIPGGGATMLPRFCWCKDFGNLRWKDKVNVGWGISKKAYIYKNCRRI